MRTKKCDHPAQYQHRQFDRTFCCICEIESLKETIAAWMTLGLDLAAEVRRALPALGMQIPLDEPMLRRLQAAVETVEEEAGEAVYTNGVLEI